MAEKVDRSKSYGLGEAVALVKEMAAGGKFDQTVEVHIKLGIDTKQSDQQVRGSVALPKGIGKSVRVVVFCDGEDVAKAKEAGAMEAGADELVEKIQGGWLDFDVAVATRSMMPKIGRLGRVLGPRGLMPSPKSGTVTEDVAAAVGEFSAGRVEVRADADGNVHGPVGKASFAADDLVTNVKAFTDYVRSARPSAVKGTYIQKVSIAASMTPGVPVAVE
jgi:large subunit ribosomal protein L1